MLKIIWNILAIKLIMIFISLSIATRIPTVSKECVLRLALVATILQALALSGPVITGSTHLHE